MEGEASAFLRGEEEGGVTASRRRRGGGEVMKGGGLVVVEATVWGLRGRGEENS